MRNIMLGLFFCTQAATVLAQESYKVSVLKQAPPAAAAAAIRELISDQGFRIQDDKGQTLADIWLRKAIPASEKPSGPKGGRALSFSRRRRVDRRSPVSVRRARLPRSADRKGCLHDAIRLAAGKRRPPGSQRLSRLSRCFCLPPRIKRRRRRLASSSRPSSAESAGTSHPAVLLLQAALPRPRRLNFPSMVRDDEKNTWSVAVPLNILGQGRGGADRSARASRRRRSGRGMSGDRDPCIVLSPPEP